MRTEVLTTNLFYGGCSIARGMSSIEFAPVAGGRSHIFLIQVAGHDKKLYRAD
ncbi:hypothetical protein QUB63_19280 [Microcoleus sp. ARI1-B5]|uniref:hypothetical protein n=1 Tax=unclassified Microcoleus TaxID=2642155 RepID=UPI002FD6F188